MERLTNILGRNPGIMVATVDYLVNVQKTGEDISLISMPRVAALAEIALRDGLTQFYDHATFQLKLLQEIERFKRYGIPVSLVMADMDHFKGFNDAQGHQKGDRLLREIARHLRQSLRKNDIPARYGGEELALILPTTEIKEALDLAERLREEIGRKLGGTTISMGIAACPRDGTSRKKLIEKADQALYRAKKEGRNRVVIAEG